MNAALIPAEAPEIHPGYPYKRRLFPAWQAAWDKLRDAMLSGNEALDGRVLADEVAPEHGLTPQTLVGVFSRAAAAGLLERELRPVESTRGVRHRTFYRIKY